MGEIARRVTGQTVGQVLAGEVAGPLGLDLWIGLPEGREPRVAPVRSGLSSSSLAVAAAAAARNGPTTVASRVSFASLDTSEFNERYLHEVELPAANGLGSPRALTRMYAACIGDVDGVRLLDDASLGRACEVQSDGTDEVTAEENRFGLGFYLPFARLPMAGPTSFGHDGAGGALAFRGPRVADGVRVHHGPRAATAGGGPRRRRPRGCREALPGVVRHSIASRFWCAPVLLSRIVNHAGRSVDPD